MEFEGSSGASKSFFGIYKVYAVGDRHVFKHGVTVHGWQDLTPEGRSEPQTYYTRSGPAGQVFEAYGSRPLADQVALVGLGTGALTAYGREGQTMTAYEVDRAVADIAADPRYFTYLADTAADVEVVVGDGRLKIAEAAHGGFGLVVLDAFGSDSVPAHLLTTEAFALYQEKLRADGVLLVHITNKHLDLKPVLSATARRAGLTGVVWDDRTWDEATGRVPSKWAVLAADERHLAPLAGHGQWQPLTTRNPVVWTDDFSNILSVLQWNRQDHTTSPAAD